MGVCASKNMPPAAYDDWAPAARVLARPELWGIIAEHSGVVGAWGLTGVCRASREGAKVWLRRLPGLVVCDGLCGGGRGTRGTRVCGGLCEDSFTSEVFRLDMGELRWERMPNLTRGRGAHACCAVRGGNVVLGA